MINLHHNPNIMERLTKPYKWRCLLLCKQPMSPHFSVQTLHSAWIDFPGNGFSGKTIFMLHINLVLQIRSHAQKYFLKVQKNGTSEHVPPPRPKRKAAHPYPQKASKNGESSNLVLQVTILHYHFIGASLYRQLLHYLLLSCRARICPEDRSICHA